MQKSSPIASRPRAGASRPFSSRIRTSITSMAPRCCSSVFPARPSTRAPPTSSTSRADLASTVTQMRARFGAETIPADIQIPQAWPGTHFTVDGQAVDIIAGLQGDVGPGPRNNVVWVPSLAAAIVGDIAFDQVHLSLRATDADSRKAWQETLRLVQERSPRIGGGRTQAPPGPPGHSGRARLQPRRTSPSSRLPWRRPTARASSWPP